MDGSYKHVSVRAYQGGDGKHDFDEFAETVIRNLRSRVSVGATTTSEAAGQYRDISFSAARPVAQADWVAAISGAAQACGVLSDQASWSMDG